MLCPKGSRWMQTFRKLPTIEPKIKKTTLQKWKGTLCQTSGSNIGLIIVAKAAVQKPSLGKLQNPSSKHQRNSKSQVPKPERERGTFQGPIHILLSAMPRA